jgi:hypothetical protein
MRPHALLPAIFKYHLNPPPPPPIVVSLLCCFTLLVGIPSSLSCVGGGAWNNTNKVHPITSFFFFLIFQVFLFFSFLYMLFVFVFVCHFCFELNNFVLV